MLVSTIARSGTFMECHVIKNFSKKDIKYKFKKQRCTHK